MVTSAWGDLDREEDTSGRIGSCERGSASTYDEEDMRNEGVAPFPGSAAARGPSEIFSGILFSYFFFNGSLLFP